MKKEPLKLTIIIEGDDICDLDNALKSVVAHIERGSLSGQNKTKAYSYDFKIDGFTWATPASNPAFLLSGDKR
jgi:hypothetical protein